MNAPLICPCCRTQWMGGRNLESQSFDYAGPWSALYEVALSLCNQCRQYITFCRTSFEGGTCAWWQEMLGELDYRVVWNKRGPYRLDGKRPVWGIWAWHPMGPEWNARVAEQIRQDDSLRLSDAVRVLVIPPKANPDEWLGLTEDLVHSIWRLDEAFMQGSVGPYPSLRAERAIWKTLACYGAFHVRHFWPAVTLHQSDYRPLAPADQLRQSYSEFIRRSISVQVPEAK